MRTLLTAIACAAVLGVVCAGSARASSYEGWGDTGWTQYNKRDCCNLAVQYEYQDGVDRCMNTGGRPDTMGAGQQRGSCQWNTMQDEQGDLIFRCSSTTTVECWN